MIRFGRAIEGKRNNSANTGESSDNRWNVLATRDCVSYLRCLPCWRNDDGSSVLVDVRKKRRVGSVYDADMRVFRSSVQNTACRERDWDQ